MEKNTSYAKIHPPAEHKTDFIHDDTQQNLPENLSLKSAQPTATSWRGVLFTLMAAAISFAAYCFLPYDHNANKGLAILLFVGLLWLTEAVHITVTALLVPVLAVVFKIPNMNTSAALAGFADPVIYVFFGGFALASALHIQRLDRKIALQVIALSRGSLFTAVMLIFAVTTFLSMWISNTATAAMMLPLAMGLMSHLDPEKDRNTFTFVLLGIASIDSIIALIAAALVVVFGTVGWREVARNTDLGVLFLFGGGIALSSMMNHSGASAALGNEVAKLLSGAPHGVVIIAVTSFIILLTNFTSNTASAALLVPMFASIAAQMGLPERVLALVIGIGASCAFMLPVGTPPNAIVFATGKVRQRDMVGAGLMLSVLSIAAISVWAYCFLM